MEYGNGKINHLVWKSSKNRYHHEETDLTLDNLNVNISLLGKEVEEGAYILDIGCGEGKFAKLLKGKNCHLYGVEIDQEAIRAAKQNDIYKDIYNFNIEMPELNKKDYERFLQNKLEFDYIALIDVLEHTVNPTKIILEVFKYLKNDGKILVSIPNVNNADILLNLLRGRFNYMEAGILDNTHTKYFTKISFVQWIEEINQCFDITLDCKYLGGTYGLTRYLNEVKESMPRLFELIQLNPEFNIIQNLFILYKKDTKEDLRYLNELIKEDRRDLVKILSDYLEEGINEKYLHDIGEVKMLPNERCILEERVNSAEKGWKECDVKYQEALKGWGECDAKYQEVLKEREKCEVKYQEALKEREKCEVKYQEALKEREDYNAKYKEALKRCEACEVKCQEVLKGWKESDLKNQEIMEGWKKCNQILLKLQEEKNN